MKEKLFVENYVDKLKREEENLESSTLFEKRGSMYLDKDSSTWVKDIITEFLTKFPILQGSVQGITWIKKLLSRGYAVGTLRVLGGGVPVIIKDFKLYPLDVILYGNVALPLNQNTVGELMQSNSPFKGVKKVQPKETLEIFGDRLQLAPVDFPGVNRSVDPHSVVRDAVKVASFIDRIENIDEETVRNIFETINSDESVKLAFKQNGTLPVLKKLASKELISEQSIIESFVREMDIDRQYIYSDEYGNKFVKQANSKLDHVWEVQVTDEEARMLGNLYSTQDLPDNLDKYAAKKLNEYIHDKYCSQFESDTLGRFIYKTANGKQVIDDIVEIKSAEIKDNNSEYTYFPYIPNTENWGFGIVLDKNKNWFDVQQVIEKNFNTDNIVSDVPRVGDTGILIINGKATRPFKIVSITDESKLTNYGENLVNLVLHTSNELVDKNYYIINSDFNSLRRHDKDKNGFYCPRTTKYLKLGKEITDKNLKEKVEGKIATAGLKPYIQINVVKNFEKFAYYLGENLTPDDLPKELLKNGKILPLDAVFEVVDEGIEKEAGEIDIFEKNIIGRDDVGAYYLSGPDFDKYAETHIVRHLPKHEAIWAAIHMGVVEQEIEKVANLAPNEMVEIRSKITIPVKPEKFNKIAEKFYEKVANFKLKLDIDPNLVKYAAVFSNSDTVDAVLSLNLIKKYNILEFLQLIPDYERVMGELAKLLVAVRLGLSQLPETPIKAAMDSMSAVVLLLKQLESILNQSSTYKMENI